MRVMLLLLLLLMLLLVRLLVVSRVGGCLNRQSWRSSSLPSSSAVRRLAAPRPRPIPIRTANRVARSTRLANPERAAVERETATRVLTESERAMHVVLRGEAHKTVASRKAGRRVAHDFGGLGRREDGGEEGL